MPSVAYESAAMRAAVRLTRGPRRTVTSAGRCPVTDATASCTSRGTRRDCSLNSGGGEPGVAAAEGPDGGVGPDGCGARGPVGPGSSTSSAVLEADAEARRCTIGAPLTPAAVVVALVAVALVAVALVVAGGT